MLDDHHAISERTYGGTMNVSNRGIVGSWQVIIRGLPFVRSTSQLHLLLTTAQQPFLEQSAHFGCVFDALTSTSALFRGVCNIRLIALLHTIHHCLQAAPLIGLASTIAMYA